MDFGPSGGACRNDWAKKAPAKFSAAASAGRLREDDETIASYAVNVRRLQREGMVADQAGPEGTGTVKGTETKANTGGLGLPFRIKTAYFYANSCGKDPHMGVNHAIPDPVKDGLSNAWLFSA